MERLTKPPSLKLGGNVSANGVFYQSAENQNREPFTYFLQGNLNLSVFDFSIPVSYSYSNQGGQLGYSVPFNLNRLSLHPKYKWLTAHIGDVNMSFSPYTLNGHQFTGAGFDAEPNNKIRFSAMYGRLLKATPADDDPRTVPAFKRVGYGTQLQYTRPKFDAGMALFYASDQENSIPFPSDSLGVLPRENLVLGFKGGIQLMPNLKLQAEFASSALTNDSRSEKASERSHYLGLLLQQRLTTSYKNAINLGLQYQLLQASWGIRYERIDPGYQTLGAYYFNNDFENITLDVARSFFENKLNLTLNVGYQRDDLDDQKANPTQRFVGSVNASIVPSDTWNISGSYSNFNTFTNVRANQFDDINDDNLIDNVIDTLNYKQLSRNASVNISHILSNTKEKNQTLNLNYNLSDVANEQGGVVRLGDASTFHNLSLSYSLVYGTSGLRISPSVNATYNTIGLEEAITWGPTLGVGKPFFGNRLNTFCSLSYNQTENNSGNIQNTSIRANANYTFLKRHNLSINTAQLFRNHPAQKVSEFTATLGYQYAFDVFEAKLQRNKTPKTADGILQIKYKGFFFQGTQETISLLVRETTTKKSYLPMVGLVGTSLERKLQVLETQIGKKDKTFRSKVLPILDDLNTYALFLENYEGYIKKAYMQLRAEAEASDKKLTADYIRLIAIQNDSVTKKTNAFRKRVALVNTRYQAHKKMLEGLKSWDFEDAEKQSADYLVFRQAQVDLVYDMVEKHKKVSDIVGALMFNMADFYHKQ
jgi:hypothetical protein